MSTTQSTASGFDAIAPFYDFISRLVFGNTLRNAQSHWLEYVPKNADILVFGGGSGWLLSRILVVCIPRKVIYVDASPVMISHAQKKVKNDIRVDFRVGTEASIQSTDQFDVLFTPFILDLFTDERLKNDLFPLLFRSLRSTGFWFCVDFIEPTTWWQSLVIWSQYRFFRTISHIEVDRLPSWVSLLKSISQLTLCSKATFLGGMIMSGYWQKVGDLENRNSD